MISKLQPNEVKETKLPKILTVSRENRIDRNRTRKSYLGFEQAAEDVRERERERERGAYLMGEFGGNQWEEGWTQRKGVDADIWFLFLSNLLN